MKPNIVRSSVAGLFSLAVVAGFFMKLIDETVFNAYASMALGYFFGKNSQEEENIETEQITQQARQLNAKVVTRNLGEGHVRAAIALAMCFGLVFGFAKNMLDASVFITFASTTIGYYFSKDKNDSREIEYQETTNIIDQTDIDLIEG